MTHFSSRSRFALAGSASLLAITLLATQANAQTDPAVAGAVVTVDEAAAARNDNVILVSARRRDELLTDVPLAISAFSAESLQALQVTDIVDVAELTPGFAMQDNSRQNEQPFIRGMSVNSFFRDSQKASFFHDGVFRWRSGAHYGRR